MQSQKRYDLIPDEAFLFMPPADAVITGKYRHIFGGQIPFNEFEQTKLKQFDKWLQSSKTGLQAYWTSDLRLRFLQSNEYNFEKTRKNMQEHMLWRSTAILRDPPYQITKHLEKGIVYHCGRDHYFRPILIINVKKISDSKLSVEEACSIMGFYFNFIIENLFIQGQVENWITIVDLDKVSLMSAGSTMKSIISFLSNTFRCYLKNSYIVKCPSTMYIFWSGVKGFLEEQTVKKIQMFDNNVPKSLFVHTHPAQVEQKYGGTKPNMTSFWPMALPPGPYEYGNTRNYMVTKQQYKKMQLAHQLKSRKVNEKYLLEEAISNKAMSPPELPTFKTVQTDHVVSDTAVSNSSGSMLTNKIARPPQMKHLGPSVVAPTEMAPLPPLNTMPLGVMPQTNFGPGGQAFRPDPILHQINSSQIHKQLKSVRQSDAQQSESMASLAPKNIRGSQHHGYQPPMNQVPVSGSLLVLDHPGGQMTNNMQGGDSFARIDPQRMSPERVITSDIHRQPVQIQPNLMPQVTPPPRPPSPTPPTSAALTAPPMRTSSSIPSQVLPPQPPQAPVINIPAMQPIVPQIFQTSHQQSRIKVTSYEDQLTTTERRNTENKHVHFQHPKAVRLPFKPYVVPATFNFDMDADEGILEQIMVTTAFIKPPNFQ